jgi:hypothetical protein
VPSGDGIYNVAPALTYHSYYYYLHRVGQWTVDNSLNAEELHRRLFEAGAQTPVLISIVDYEAAVTGVALSHGGGQPLGLPPVVRVSPAEQVLILLPGPYAACVSPMLNAGGQLVAEGNDLAVKTR